MSLFIIGLTGNIAAGKSTVARTLAGLGCNVIDTDEIAKYHLPTFMTPMLGKWKHLLPAQRPENAPLANHEIADVIFNHAEEREWLQELLHPLVLEAIHARLRCNVSQVVVIESALLFEARLDVLCHKTVCVDAPTDKRMAWAESKNIREFRKRDQLQMKPSEKRDRADFVILNNGTRDTLAKHISFTMLPLLTPYFVDSRHDFLSYGEQGEG